MQMNKTKQIQTLIVIFLLAVSASMMSCRRFIYGEIRVDEENDPRLEFKVPHTSADTFFKEPPVVNTPNLSNPDKEGAFADWATCLVMVKEGHKHGPHMMHGNFVYEKAPWRQEEFALVHNTPTRPKVEVVRESSVTYLEKKRGMQGPDYLRLIAGSRQMWGLCFYFYDKNGQLINDKILNDSKHYQLFFTISDLDENNKPYTIMNYRWRGNDPSTVRFDWANTPRKEWPEDKLWPKENPIPSEYFKDKTTFKERQAETKRIIDYIYRDTWKHDDMGDGARLLYNIKLLPPFTKKDFYQAEYPADVDRVGLKGIMRLDMEGLDTHYDAWPERLTNGLYFSRSRNLLPKFCIAVRVLKKTDGNKLVRSLEQTDSEGNKSRYQTGRKSDKMCADFTGPEDETGWVEIIRFNIPVKIYADNYDSDPTQDDPYEPYNWQIGMEIHLSPTEIREAMSNLIIHNDQFPSWFL